MNLLSLIEALEEDGFDLQYEQFVLQWNHPQRPDVQITLYIGAHEGDIYDLDREIH